MSYNENRMPCSRGPFLFAPRNSLKLRARVQVVSFIADQCMVGRGGCSLCNRSKHMGILS